MSFNIDKTLYPELFSYSVLAQTGITTPVTSDPTTINYGYYGNAGGLGQITGTYEGSAVINNLSTTISSANSQLATVVGLINSNSFTVPYSGGPNTFGPGILFTTGVESLPAGNITPSGTLTFDGGFIATSQFFIAAPASYSIIFSDPLLTFEFINYAQPENVFWLANNGSGASSIYVNTGVSSIYGNMIGGKSVIIEDTGTTITGSIFAQNNQVSFLFGESTTTNNIIVNGATIIAYTPIDKTLYPNLFSYSVLGQTGITSGAITTINNGFYGNAGGAGQITGTFNGGATQNNDPTNISTANSQLTRVVGIINSNRFTSDYTGGSFIFNPGILYTTTGFDIFASGTLYFDAGGDTDAQFFIATPDTYSITFVVPITFEFLNGAQAENIFWLANGSGVVSIGGDVSDGSTINGNLIGGSQVTIVGSRTINGSIFAEVNDVTFNANTTVNANVVCYLKGTKILTENGYVLIEDLKVGDNVVTKGKIINNKCLELDNDYSVKPIIWIGNFQAPNLNKKTFPICIKANALGDNLPSEDLYVSPGHRIIIDCKMVCARDLINGTTIFQDEDLISVHYYHLELNEHYSIIANNILSETYKDFGIIRNLFKNKIELPSSQPIVA